MHRKLLPVLFLALAFWLTACSPQAAAVFLSPLDAGTPTGDPGQGKPSSEPVTPTRSISINVMAAASLTGAFQELGSQFEASHPNTNVEFNFAGSQQLAQQLSQGAPADVFASANQKQMDVVLKTGRIQSSAVKTFAHNRLVVIFPVNNPAKIETLADLAKPNLKLILAAKEVPVGQYSLDFLDKASASGNYGANFKDRVLANVVSYENNVNSVLTKIALGEGDAGIVYTSDITGTDAGSVNQIQIPDNLNVIASYPIAAVEDSTNRVLAQQFVDLVLSPQGQTILKKYGLIPVNLH